MRDIKWELRNGFRHGFSGPDAGDIARMQKEAEARAEEMATKNRAQELEDRAYFKAEAKKERELQEERAQRLAARKKLEEKSRIKSLADAESDASEEAGDITGTVDPDQSFGNMFAALLSGMGRTASSPTSKGPGMRKVSLPSNSSSKRRIT